jgi:hypothetical protein
MKVCLFSCSSWVTLVLLICIVLFSSAHGQSFKVVHDFSGTDDRANPLNGLMLSSNGVLRGPDSWSLRHSPRRSHRWRQERRWNGFPAHSVRRQVEFFRTYQHSGLGNFRQLSKCSKAQIIGSTPPLTAMEITPPARSTSSHWQTGNECTCCFTRSWARMMENTSSATSCSAAGNSTAPPTSAARKILA